MVDECCFLSISGFICGRERMVRDDGTDGAADEQSSRQNKRQATWKKRKNQAVRYFYYGLNLDRLITQHQFEEEYSEIGRAHV